MTLSSPLLLQVETGLQQLMGDRVLYMQILRRFRQRYQDSADQARQALLACDIAAAQRIVHTLKGAAGMVGAQQVFLLSAALEPACAGPAALCMGPLSQLEQALRATMGMVDTVLDEDEAQAEAEAARLAAAGGDSALAAAGGHPAMAGTPGARLAVAGKPDPAAARMLVQHLARLLEEGDGAAIDVLEQSATALAAYLGVGTFKEVSQTAHLFDFEAALALLLASSADCLA